MPKQTRLEKLEHVNAGLDRLQRRLLRTTNAIAKLSAQRKRLLKPRRLDQLDPPIPAAVPEFNDPVPTFKSEPVVSDVTDIPVTELPIPDVLEEDGLGIPAFLSRKPLDAVAQTLLAEQVDLKKRKARGRIAKLKATQSGETRKMPLTGKAALAAIRGEG